MGFHSPYRARLLSAAPVSIVYKPTWHLEANATADPSLLPDSNGCEVCRACDGYCGGNPIACLRCPATRRQTDNCDDDGIWFTKLQGTSVKILFLACANFSAAPEKTRAQEEGPEIEESAQCICRAQSSCRFPATSFIFEAIEDYSTWQRTNTNALIKQAYRFQSLVFTFTQLADKLW